MNELLPGKPALVIDGGKAMCGLVLTEEATGVEPKMWRVLGIGCGCSMPDADTSEADIAEFDRRSRKMVFG